MKSDEGKRGPGAEDDEHLARAVGQPYDIVDERDGEVVEQRARQDQVAEEEEESARGQGDESGVLPGYSEHQDTKPA